ncbi:MAG: competence/damage-inducible protein A [Saprospiraceae bacterium]|nr:competence/damage-inducible protein A [Bacteroidia bacterium]NNE13455.1 competence/damage-inducible protein A [Saprospiraceae bacterium]
MKSSILTIGDEILIGQIVDTNSAWLGKKLTELGIPVNEIISLADTKESIKKSIENAMLKSDLILLTGGLGPTKDDVTKAAIAEFLNVGTYFDENLYNKISQYFIKRNLPISKYVKIQSTIPETAQLLTNNVGTAPGMLFKKDNKVIISMPGVPHEMKWIFKNSIIPILPQLGKIENNIYQRTIKTIGIGETRIAAKIEDITDTFPEDISLAFLPSSGQVRLRVMSSSQNDNTVHVDKFVNQISSRLGDYVYGYDSVIIEDALKDLFISKNLTLSTAESCTGGYLSHRITSVPGSSKYYIGSLIAYDNHIKESQLNVQSETLLNHGAVSEATVIEMLSGLLNKTGTDIGIAISGIAGPNGGTPDKPVGTIWVAYGTLENYKTKKLTLFKERLRNIHYTATAGMNLLRLFVLNNT